jgi:hypothetical protein
MHPEHPLLLPLPSLPPLLLLLHSEQFFASLLCPPVWFSSFRKGS